MNFYEADIPRLQKRIKEMEENPGRRLKSYRIYLEKTIEERREQIEGLRQGRPFFENDEIAILLFRAMGFLPLSMNQAVLPKDGDLVGERSPLALKERTRALGIPVDNMCEMSYSYVAIADAGDLAEEPIVLCTQRVCPMWAFQKLFIAHQLGKWPESSFVYIDKPPEENEASLEYLVEQYRQFIEVAEKKFPGVIKYDEDKLAELQATEKAVNSYKHEVYEMSKHQPSPIAGWDICETIHWGYRNLEYARTRRDEVAERLEKGIAAVPGEKLRVLWNAEQIHFFDAFEFLAEKWQVASVFWLGPGGAIASRAPMPRPAYYGGRKLTPLEEEAAHALQQLRSAPAARWVDHLIRICRDLKIDAVINALQLGANCYIGLKGMIAERVEKELGIPVLQLEMARWNSGYIDEATLKAKLGEFAQMCLARKGLA